MLKLFARVLRLFGATVLDLGTWREMQDNLEKAKQEHAILTAQVHRAKILVSAAGRDRDKYRQRVTELEVQLDQADVTGAVGQLRIRVEAAQRRAFDLEQYLFRTRGKDTSPYL